MTDQAIRSLDDNLTVADLKDIMLMFESRRDPARWSSETAKAIGAAQKRLERVVADADAFSAGLRAATQTAERISK